ncbi:MAG: hypothetical protein KBD78_08660, partial [Oligoflexales bacterium]|nr:hypothetical protein [Oligoflexales bacterium]
MTDTLPSSNPEPISSKKILYAEIERLENRLRSLNKKDYAFRKEFLDTFKLIGTLVGSTPFKWIYFFTFPFTLLFRLLFLRVTPPEVKEQAKSYFKKFRNELRNFKNPLDTEIVGFISEIEQSITIGSKAAQNRHAAETSKSVLIGNITIPTAEYYKTDSAKKIKVACILDTFSTASWDPEFELIHLTRGKWKRQIEQNKPAFLLVESAWRGH